jgi:hypothetical protein
MRLVSRFGRINQIRRDRPLTRDELMQFVPSVFGEDKHAREVKNILYSHHRTAGKPAARRVAVLCLPVTGS